LIDALFLVVFLFNSLPSILSVSEQLTFKGLLHDTINHEIQIVNQSNYHQEYTWNIAKDDVNAANFTIANHSPFSCWIQIPPKGQTLLRVQYRAVFSRQTSAKLIVRSKTPTVSRSFVQVFNLITDIISGMPKSNYRIQVPLHQANPSFVARIPVSNPFTEPGHFLIELKEQIWEEQIAVNTKEKQRFASHASMNAISSRAPSTKLLQSNASLLGKTSPTKHLVDFPVFMLSKKVVQIEPEGTVTLPITVIPLDMTSRECYLHFIDPKIGEFSSRLVLDVLPPVTTEKFQWRLRPRVSTLKWIDVPFTNPIRARALETVQRNCSEPGRLLSKSNIDPLLECHYRVHCSSPYFSCPNELRISAADSNEQPEQRYALANNEKGNLSVTFTPQVSVINLKNIAINSKVVNFKCFRKLETISAQLL
jgi:hypothetical protein